MNESSSVLIIHFASTVSKSWSQICTCKTICYKRILQKSYIREIESSLRTPGSLNPITTTIPRFHFLRNVVSYPHRVTQPIRRLGQSKFLFAVLGKEICKLKVLKKQLYTSKTIVWFDSLVLFVVCFYFLFLFLFVLFSLLFVSIIDRNGQITCGDAICVISSVIYKHSAPLR